MRAKSKFKALGTALRAPTFEAMTTWEAHMAPWEIIEGLYDVEINVGLQADWNGGITGVDRRSDRYAKKSDSSTPDIRA